MGAKRTRTSHDAAVPTAGDAEVAENWALVNTPLGEEWSGRARYAAAMFFCQRGEMAPEVLEVYRICSRLDGEDPVSVLTRWRIGADWIARLQAFRDTSALRHLPAIAEEEPAQRLLAFACNIEAAAEQQPFRTQALDDPAQHRGRRTRRPGVAELALPLRLHEGGFQRLHMLVVEIVLTLGDGGEFP